MNTLYELIIVILSVERGKIIPCKTLLNHELEKSTMKCREQEVVYVEKQVLVSYIPSIEISENSCHTEETDGECTITLPRNDTESGGILFPIGNFCNLRRTCMLKDLKSLAVSSISDFSTQKFKSTSFTYTCIKRKQILSLVGNHPSFSTTTSSVYLAIDKFSGNINCDVTSPLKYMYLLQLKWASLVVLINDEQLYDNKEKDLYGEDISLYVNGSNCTTCLYSLNISSARQGRVWLHLKGDNVTVNCTRLSSSLYPFVTTETTMNMTLFDHDVLYIKDYNSHLFILSVSGLVLALLLMAGIYVMQRRNDLKKLNNLVQQNDSRISSEFGDHVTDAAEIINIYSEISSTRRNSAVS